MRLLLLALVLCFPLNVPAQIREKREIIMAERIFLREIAREASPEAREACRKAGAACGQGNAELAMAHIGSRFNSSPLARTTFVSLTRFNLDGAASEDFTCYVLQGGRVGLQAMATMTTAALVDRCHREVEEARRLFDFRDISPERLCATKERIESRRRDLTRALRSGERCSDQDF